MCCCSAGNCDLCNKCVVCDADYTRYGGCPVCHGAKSTVPELPCWHIFPQFGRTLALFPVVAVLYRQERLKMGHRHTNRENRKCICVCVFGEKLCCDDVTEKRSISFTSSEKKTGTHHVLSEKKQQCLPRKARCHAFLCVDELRNTTSNEGI